MKQHSAAQEMAGKSREKCRKRENDKCGQMCLSIMNVYLHEHGLRLQQQPRGGLI